MPLSQDLAILDDLLTRAADGRLSLTGVRGGDGERVGESIQDNEGRGDGEAVRDREGGRRAALVGLAERAGWITRVPGGGDERRDSQFRLDPAGGSVVGFDVGGTKLIGAIADLSGRILAEQSEATRHDGERGALEQMAGMVRSLASAAGRSAGEIRRIGVGVPGAVSRDGAVALSPNLAWPAEVPVAPLLSALCGGVPVHVENDVNAAVQGEYWRGGGRERWGSEPGSLAFLSFGTGVGLGLMIDGRTVTGAGGAAGEIAFMPAGSDPFAAAKVAPGGAYEALVGSAGIRARYGDGALSVEAIFDRAAAGDERANRVLDETARQAAVGVATIAALLDPNLIVLGGGIGTRADFAAAVARHAAALLPNPPRVAVSRLAARAGLVGAVMVALIDLRRDQLAGGDGPVREATAAA